MNEAGNELLYIEEIRRRFAAEWILLGDPQTSSLNQVISGTILWHSKDRDELYAKALALQPRHSAIIYTGTLPLGMAVVL